MLIDVSGTTAPLPGDTGTNSQRRGSAVDSNMVHPYEPLRAVPSRKYQSLIKGQERILDEKVSTV